MHALRHDAAGRLSWDQVPDPAAGPGQVVIDIRAAGVNRADLLQRAGTYPPPAGWPAWMGLEVAGVIAQAAPGTPWKKGDAVCALIGGGGYAERVAVPAGLVLPVPEGFSFTQAAAIPEVFATAWLNLVWEAGLQPGETALIHAGASGLGLAAIQIARWRGAQVITTVSSTAKADAVRDAGADIIVNRHSDDLDAVLDQHPVNVTLDCVGGAQLGRHFEKMARGGRWVLVATLGGATTEISLRALLTRGLRLIGSTLRSRPDDLKVRLLAEIKDKLWPLLASGRMRPHIHAVLPIAQAEQAHAILQANANIGKVILTLAADGA